MYKFIEVISHNISDWDIVKVIKNCYDGCWLMIYNFVLDPQSNCSTHNAVDDNNIHLCEETKLNAQFICITTEVICTTKQNPRPSAIIWNQTNHPM